MSNGIEEVDRAILDDLLGPGGGVGGPEASQGGYDQLAALAAALGIVERHLGDLTNRQLAALLWLKQRGGQWSELADQYLEHRHLVGGPGPLLQALESASLIKNFKGYSGRVLGSNQRGRRGGGGLIP